MIAVSPITTVIGIEITGIYIGKKGFTDWIVFNAEYGYKNYTFKM